MNWAVATYDSAFGYVSAHGAPLVDLLDPQPDERIIDLGCGTGTFSAAIAERGATVLGIDGSPEMIAQASATYPDLKFAVGDAHNFTTSEPYDAVASNAALHWMTRDPDAVLKAVHAALRPGGRFVAEMGGAGNCAELIAAMQTAWRIFGLDEPELPWYFPTPAEYATRLEKAGFTVRLLEYFDRPTRMTEGPNGAADWVRVFAASALKEVPPEIVEPLLARINELAAPALRRESGWVADYVRLRFAAVRKPDSSTPQPEGPGAHGQGAPRGGIPSEGPVTIRSRPTAHHQDPPAPPPAAQAHQTPTATVQRPGGGPGTPPQGSPAPAPGTAPSAGTPASGRHPGGPVDAPSAHPSGPHGMPTANRHPGGAAQAPSTQTQGTPTVTVQQPTAPAGASAAYPGETPPTVQQPPAPPGTPHAQPPGTPAAGRHAAGPQHTRHAAGPAGAPPPDGSTTAPQGVHQQTPPAPGAAPHIPHPAGVTAPQQVPPPGATVPQQGRPPMPEVGIPPAQAVDPTAAGHAPTAPQHTPPAQAAAPPGHAHAPVPPDATGPMTVVSPDGRMPHPRVTETGPLPPVTETGPLPPVPETGPLPLVTETGPLPPITETGPLPSVTETGPLPPVPPAGNSPAETPAAPEN